MCVPLGHRRTSRSSRKEAITKSQVERIINFKDFECEYSRLSDSEFSPYEGCRDNLLLILYDEETTVKVADQRFKVYKEGFQTIVMDAPCFPAVILLRIKE